MPKLETVNGFCFYSFATERERKKNGAFKKLKFWKRSDKEIRRKNIGDESLVLLAGKWRQTQATKKNARKPLENRGSHEDISILQFKEKTLCKCRLALLNSKHRLRKYRGNRSLVEVHIQATDLSNVNGTQLRCDKIMTEEPPRETIPVREKLGLGEKPGKGTLQVVHPQQKVPCCRKTKIKGKGLRIILGLLLVRNVATQKQKRSVKFIMDVKKGDEELHLSDKKYAVLIPSIIPKENQFVAVPSCSKQYTLLTGSSSTKLRDIFPDNNSRTSSDKSTNALFLEKHDSPKAPALESSNIRVVDGATVAATASMFLESDKLLENETIYRNMTYDEKSKVLETASSHGENNKIEFSTKDRIWTQQYDVFESEVPKYNKNRSRRIFELSTSSLFEKDNHPDINNEKKLQRATEGTVESFAIQNSPFPPRNYGDVTGDHQIVTDQTEIDWREPSTSYKKTKDVTQEHRIEFPKDPIKRTFPRVSQRETLFPDILPQLPMSEDYSPHLCGSMMFEGNAFPFDSAIVSTSGDIGKESDLLSGAPLYKVTSFYLPDGTSEDECFSIRGNIEMPKDLISQLYYLLYLAYHYIYANELKKMEALDEENLTSDKNRVDGDTTSARSNGYKGAIENCELPYLKKTQFDSTVEPFESSQPFSLLQAERDYNCKFTPQDEEELPADGRRYKETIEKNVLLSIPLGEHNASVSRSLSSGDNSDENCTTGRDVLPMFEVTGDNIYPPRPNIEVLITMTDNLPLTYGYILTIQLLIVLTIWLTLLITIFFNQ